MASPDGRDLSTPLAALDAGQGETEGSLKDHPSEEETQTGGHEWGEKSGVRSQLVAPSANESIMV
jgi:hypothetical protein